MRYENKKAVILKLSEAGDENIRTSPQNVRKV
jgi:hypothetical protein